MPRQSRLLPYLQIRAGGQLRYVRRVRPELRTRMGGKTYFTRVLPVATTDVSDRRVIKAWAEINKQFETLQQEAEAEKAELAKRDHVEMLTPRQVAGIAAQPWRQLLQVAEQGTITEAQLQVINEVALTTIQTLSNPDVTPEEKREGMAKVSDLLLAETFKKLQIDPSAELLEAIAHRFEQYGWVASADIRRVQEGDFSEPELLRKAPALPTRQVTFEQLIDEWVDDCGGITERDGVGIGEHQVKRYRTIVKEIRESTGQEYPAQISLDLARKYLKDIQESERALKTKQTKLAMASHLYQIGVQRGFLDDNPFIHLQIKTPKGTRINNYRPFTKPELIKIFTYVNELRYDERNLIPLALLMTGARLSEIVDLRHTDIAKTKDGVWYLQMLHRPTDDYPRVLKMGASNERYTPMHPLLIERGFLNRFKKDEECYVFTMRNTESLSQWFKRILVKLSIYEKHRTGFHSLRGTAIDAWREARVAEDVRRALTAHTSKDVQDKIYGEGLQFMPDVLYKELVKVDWGWLP